MGKRLQVAAHLSVAELAERYRHEPDGRTRTHWQLLWQMATGKTVQEVAAMTGLSVGWIRRLVGRYNEHGPEAVGDQRHHNPGAAPVLTAAPEVELGQALDGPAPHGEVWSGPLVAQWISDHAQRSVTKQSGWLYLRRLDYRLRVTRPRHAKADPHAQEAFKKN